MENKGLCKRFEQAEGYEDLLANVLREAWKERHRGNIYSEEALSSGPSVVVDILISRSDHLPFWVWMQSKIQFANHAVARIGPVVPVNTSYPARLAQQIPTLHLYLLAGCEAYTPHLMLSPRRCEIVLS